MTGKLLTVTLFGVTEGMPPNFGPRALKGKKWDSMSRVHGNITEMCWKDKTDRYMTPTCS
jgi:hypothetical protein